ncbi:MAG: phytanoyl-CoA dioxygenase family protein [Ilumatobacteraceae bacterium]
MIHVAAGPWHRVEDCRLDDLVALVDRGVDMAHFPLALRLDHGALVYDAAALVTRAGTPDGRAEVLAELAEAFGDEGPGIAVFAGAFEGSVVDRASDVFRALIDDQHRAGVASGDHFAAPGANDRVWNALEKLAVAAPDVFADYYANPVVELVSAAWLGPWYQITSQVNVVNPGGQAQAPHRDYHLGFQTDEDASRFPPHAHQLSAALTLQGAVAHCDMPVETGPTMYLPNTHRYPLGYLAWRRPEFAAWFAEHHVQLPLRTGDAVFFNPALFHAAGTNRTADVRRMANLLQISSAMGRAMESVDRDRMSRALYPVLLDWVQRGTDMGDVRRVVAASAEGYPFPTNLDRDPPLGGLAPPSQADIVLAALAERLPVEALHERLDDHAHRRRT